MDTCSQELRQSAASPGDSSGLSHSCVTVVSFNKLGEVTVVRGTSEPRHLISLSSSLLGTWQTRGHWCWPPRTSRTGLPALLKT